MDPFSTGTLTPPYISPRLSQLLLEVNQSLKKLERLQTKFVTIKKQSTKKVKAL